MIEKYEEMVKECAREEENCLYNSTILILWLKALKRAKMFFIVAPIILGGFAGMKVLSTSDLDFMKYLMSASSMIAGILPAIFSSLKIEANISQVDRYASGYKLLQGKFRRLKNISSKDNEFENEFKAVIKELEELKLTTMTAPERFFVKAQSKIAKGHYDFAVDQNGK